MQLLQYQSIIGALMYLWKLRQIKLLKSMIMPLDFQIEFYKREGLTPYTEAKLPLISGR